VRNCSRKFAFPTDGRGNPEQDPCRRYPRFPGEQVPWISSSLAEIFPLSRARSRRSGRGVASDASAPPQVTPQVTPKSRPRSRPRSHPSHTQVTPNNRAARARRTPAAAARRNAISARRQSRPRSSSLRLKAGGTDRSADGGGARRRSDIKSLTAKLAVNPMTQRAVPARAGLCQQGRLQPRDQGFRPLAAAESKDVEAYNNRCWPAPSSRPAGGLEGLQRGAATAPEFCRCPRQPRPRQPEERADQECIADFDAASRSPRLTSSLYGRGLAKQRNGSISRRIGYIQCQGMDPNMSRNSRVRVR